MDPDLERITKAVEKVGDSTGETALAVARIDERTENMSAAFEREIRGVHHRIGEVRQEAREDVDTLRGELRKTGVATGASSGGIVTAIMLALKEFFTGS